MMKLALKGNTSTYDKKYFEYVNHQGHAGVHVLSSFYKGKKQPDYYSKDMFDLASRLRVNINNTQGMNYFYTPNTMKRWKRGTKEIIGLNSCWVDIDTEKVGIDKDRFEYMLEDILDQLPVQPKHIVYSGHGFYFLFPYQYQVVVHNRNSMIELWNILEKRIAKDVNSVLNEIFPFEQDACDMNATDVARLLRIQGSYNYKVNQKIRKCETVWVNDSEYEYTFFDLCDSYLPPYDPNKTKHYRKKHNLKIQTKTNFTQYTLKVSRDDDLKSLAKLRGYDLTGNRNNFLFLVACNASYYKSNDEVIKELQELNEQFTEPLPYSEMRSIECRAVHLDLANKYPFKRNQSIIDELGISEQEQKELRTIIGKKEKRTRKNKTRKANYHAKSNQSGAKRKKRNRNNKIIKLRKSGMSYRAISKVMNLSVNTVRKALMNNR